MLQILLIMLRLNLLPQWMHDQQADEKHFYRRTFSPRYRRKRRIVCYVWATGSASFVLMPIPAFAIGMALACTFLSLVILDES